MPRNNTPIILGAVVFGLLAVVLTVFLLLPRGGGTPAPVTPPAPTTATQLVARKPIPPRTRVTADMFKEETTDKSKIPANAITDRTQLASLITNAPIETGQVLTKDMMTTTTLRVTPVYFEVPQGLRAVGIYVDANTTAAGLVDVGDHVDVIANAKVTLKTGADITSTNVASRTIAQNLVVLAVDRSINAPPPTPTPQPAAPGTAPAPPPPAPAATPPPAKTRVMLAADPITSEHLVAANEAGTLHITIRNPTEVDNAPREPALEYPTRIVATTGVDKILNNALGALTGKSTTSTTSTPSTGSTRRRRGSNYTTPPDLGYPILNGGGLLPANPSGNTTTTTTALPPVDNTKEVTVIRGTEKTRVIVPADGASH